MISYKAKTKNHYPNYMPNSIILLCLFYPLFFTPKSLHSHRYAPLPAQKERQNRL